MGRIGQPREIATVALFLASEDSRRPISKFESYHAALSSLYVHV
jgi:NAD(P)-dependent dehydrogenase (short-subunit alcohol dehydrogenase family)